MDSRAVPEIARTLEAAHLPRTDAFARLFASSGPAPASQSDNADLSTGEKHVVALSRPPRPPWPPSAQDDRLTASWREHRFHEEDETFESLLIGSNRVANSVELAAYLQAFTAQDSNPFSLTNQPRASEIAAKLILTHSGGPKAAAQTRLAFPWSAFVVASLSLTVFGAVFVALVGGLLQPVIAVILLIASGFLSASSFAFLLAVRRSAMGSIQPRYLTNTLKLIANPR